MNNIIKINMALEEINAFNYNYHINLNKKPYLDTIIIINSNLCNHYINKSKDIISKYNKTKNNNDRLSLKYLKQDVKLKNRTNLKQLIILVEKKNQILNNIFNYIKNQKIVLK